MVATGKSSPFEAFGLPDQYARTSPAVALFGFGYDEPFQQVLGEPWPGVVSAHRGLSAEALASSRPFEDMRREREKNYDLWLAEQTEDADRAERAGAGPTPQRKRRASGG